MSRNSRPADMSEEELLQAFYTHHQRMESASLLQRHNNVHRQMAAFAELLRRLRDRYASDQLQQMLYAIAVGIPDLPRRPRMSRDSLPYSAGDSNLQLNVDIYNLSQLRQLIDEMSRNKRRRRGIQKEDERHVVHYFRSFFADLEHLATLKLYFEERIYACLYQYYYQPNAMDEGLPYNDDGSSRHGSGRPLASLCDEFSANEVWIIPDGTTVSDIIRQVWTMSRDWDMIVTNADQQVNVDGIENDGEQFENILQLIPRWVNMGLKILQLCKVWWTEANKVYYKNSTTPRSTSGSVTQRSSAPAELRQRVAPSAERLSALNEIIIQTEIMIESLEDDLKQRIKDERRLELLIEKLSAAESRELQVRQRYDEILSKRRSSERKSSNDDDVEGIRSLLHSTFQELEAASYEVNLIRDEVDFERSICSNEEDTQRSPGSKMSLERQLRTLLDDLTRYRDEKFAMEQLLNELNQRPDALPALRRGFGLPLPAIRSPQKLSRSERYSPRNDDVINGKKLNAEKRSIRFEQSEESDDDVTSDSNIDVVASSSKRLSFKAANVSDANVDVNKNASTSRHPPLGQWRHSAESGGTSSSQLPRLVHKNGYN